MKKTTLVFLMFMFFGQIRLLAQDEARLLRFPAIYDNQLVFTYAGDLYTVHQMAGLQEN